MSSQDETKAWTTRTFRVPSNVRKLWYEQELSTLTKEIRAWIEASTGQKIHKKTNLFDALRDGRLLCALVEKFFPKAKAIPIIHPPGVMSSDKKEYKHMENIHFFLEFQRNLLAFPPDLLFDETDLHEYDEAKTDDVLKRNILLTISLFAGYLDAHKATEWDKHRGMFNVQAGDELYFAVKALDFERVREITLRESLDLSGLTSTHGWTSLYAAAWFGANEIIALLVKNGQDPNKAIESGWYPLHAAAHRHHLHCVTSLVDDHKALVNVLSAKGTTPLFCASKKNRRQIVDFLLDRGADPNLSGDDESAWKPIHAAVHHHCHDIIAVLVKNGARIDAPFHVKKYTPLHLAIADQAVNMRVDTIAAVLWHKPNLEAKNFNGHTPLALAAVLGEGDCVRLLLAHDANAHTSSNHFRNPLELAVRNGHMHTAQVLADHMKVPVPTLKEHGISTHEVVEPNDPPAPAEK